MDKIKARLKSRKGTSLVELLIALALTGVLTTAIMGLYYRQHANYVIQDDVTQVQQNARASIDELSRQIRLAGYSLPGGVPALVAANTNPDSITINYQTSGCETYISDPMPNRSHEIKCGSDVSCFHDDQWAYIFDPDSGGGEWFEITHVQAAGANHLQHIPLSRAYGADAIIMGMSQLKYYVDQVDDQHSNLMLKIPGSTPQVYAENVTNLQFRYRLQNGNIIDVPVLIDDVTEVLISVTAESGQYDYDSGEPKKHTRTYESSVSLRNVGL